jgi:ABC-type transporter Mla subunit MlaD
MQRGDAIKVGIISLVSIGLVTGILIWLRGASFNNGTQHTVTFTDVDGLQESAPVHLMGIRVGFVDKITPFLKDGRYRVNVTFHVDHPELDNHHTSIPRGSRLTIQQSGLIGEKFLEITPLRPQNCDLLDLIDHDLPAETPVFMPFRGGPKKIGHVLSMASQPKKDAKEDEPQQSQTVTYQITQPNVYTPETSACSLEAIPGSTNRVVLINIDSGDIPPPDTSGYFTVEPPVRLKTFLDVQLETAEALRDTNLKIARLLSEETINSLTATASNTAQLTEEAKELLAAANQLMTTAQDDVHRLVNTVESLSKSLSSVSNNINAVLDDEQLQADFKATVANIRHASNSLDDLLASDDLKKTLSYTKTTFADTSELVAELKKLSNNPEFKADLQQSLKLLNSSMYELQSLLSSVNEATGEDNKDLKELINDAEETVDNLNDFSDKLDGHFVLWRLLF